MTVKIAHGSFTFRAKTQRLISTRDRHQNRAWDIIFLSNKLINNFLIQKTLKK